MSTLGPFPRLHSVSLPYLVDPLVGWAAVADLPWPMLLDSAGGSAGGRYDVLVADPVCTVVNRGEETEVVWRAGDFQRSGEDPLAVLGEVLGPPQAGGGRYAGGAVGYLGYELGRRLEGLAGPGPERPDLPELAFGIYAWAVVTDHRRRRSRLVVRPGAPESWREVAARLSRDPPPAPEPAPFTAAGPLRTSLDRRGYARAFERVAAYVRDGDCYQINLTLGFEVPVAGDPVAAYAWLRRRSPAPFGACLGLPRATVLSNSPEGFLSLHGRRVETRPIKGTRPRRADPEADRAEARALQASAKDRAENVMIVDLLRNDLGRVCRPGSIRVPDLCRVERYANVHHLVSTVTGELGPGRGALDLVRACFPGGSITGAPKHRAMEIIEELEPWPRGVYCGAVGWLGFDGDLELSIAIRTAWHTGDARRGVLRFGAGGGVVADSVCEREYAECYDKASVLLELAGLSPR